MRLHAILLAAALASMGEAEATAPAVSPYETAIRTTLTGESSGNRMLWDLPKWRTPLVEAYTERGFTPFWFAGARLTAAGEGLLTELTSVEDRGLLASDYDFHEVQFRVRTGNTPTAAEIARADVALSAVAVRLASDLHLGRVKPRDVGYELDIRRSEFDAATALRVLAVSTNVRSTLDSFEPQLRHYALLKTALARYRVLARTRSELTNLASLPRASVRPGEVYVDAPALRRLLASLGDVPAGAATLAAEGTILDDGIVAGIKHFQARHGLEADGLLGRQTFRALTTPLAARVQQMDLSLERMRWLPAFDAPPIIVNIPQFRLFAFRTTHDAADDILQMDVIVGEAFEGRRTPVFAAAMRYVVLQPYWDVPRSILLKELLPEIRANPSWLEKHGYEIVRGEGDDARVLAADGPSVRLLEHGSARLRQRPGPSNALGRVKFMFPNRHNVYLHDTPAKALFSRSRRAFSHGCIRVSDPMALLSHVMRDDPAWNDARREQALTMESPTRVPLVKPIPVFILYGTALASEDGRVQFFDDIYGQDAPLIERLAARKRSGPVQ